MNFKYSRWIFPANLGTVFVQTTVSVQIDTVDNQCRIDFSMTHVKVFYKK